MALKVNLATSDMGIPFAGAYANIERYVGDKNAIQVVINFYASQEAYAAGATPVMRGMYEVAGLETKQFANVTVAGAIYSLLKSGSAINMNTQSTSDFAAAIDC